MSKGTIAFRQTDATKEILLNYMKANNIDPRARGANTKAVLGVILQYPELLKKQTVSIPSFHTSQKSATPKHQALLPIPEATPAMNREIKRFLNGGHSDIVEALFNVTEESFNRAFSIANGKRGIITVIPINP